MANALTDSASGRIERTGRRAAKMRLEAVPHPEPRLAGLGLALPAGPRCAYYGFEGSLERLRPWTDERAVSAVLLRWVIQRPANQATPAALRSVSRHLRGIGRDHPSITPEQAAGTVLLMIRNIAARRAPTDYGDGFELIQGDAGPSDRTKGRYRAAFGSDAGLAWLRDSLQQDLDIAALTTCDCRDATRRHGWSDHDAGLSCRSCDCQTFTGRSPNAARRWLERHPTLHAKDAPRPRRRGEAA